MILDLNTFIKVDFIRKEMEKSCVVISSIEEANQFALDVSEGKYRNVIFEKSSLKSYCFAEIQKRCDVNIINCNSCLDRFCESLSNGQAINIFDNINKCKNIDILKLIINRKGILVC